MLKRLLFFSISVALLPSLSSAEVYGSDDRRDIYQVRSRKLKAWSRAVAGVTKWSMLKETSPGKYTLSTQTLESKLPKLCSDEPFLKQPVGPFCTAFLVAPDIIVAAGHCIESEVKCQTLAFIFDYHYAKKSSSPELLTQDQIYRCQKLLHITNTDEVDFALIQLDRGVLDRDPLKLRDSGAIDPKAELVLLGFPLGLPLKIADHGGFRSTKGNLIYTNVDAFYKNSGSPVLSKSDGKVEGLIIGGDEDDFKPSPKGCQQTHICAENQCAGNYLHSSGPISQALKKYQSPVTSFSQ